MSRFTERYAQSVARGDLKSTDRSTYGGADVHGAAGLAGKKHPLAMALLRLFSGDNNAADEVVSVLAEMAWNKAGAEKIKLKRTQAVDMARAVLAWHRDGVCKTCGGHGYKTVGGELGEGRAVIGDVPCEDCKGTGRVPFDSHFALERLGIARWLREQVEREQGRAGAAAMAALAPKLDLIEKSNT